MSMYFDYTVSNVVNELNHCSKLRKFTGFSKEIPTAEQIYKYMSRYSAEQYCKIVNATLMKFNKENRGKYNRFIADATPSACDFNNDQHPNLDLEADPKLAWALRHPEAFPIDVNTADYEWLLRVPGLGTKSAWLIINARRSCRLTSEHLRKMGVVMKKAKYFITCNELSASTLQPTRGINELSPERLRPLLASQRQQRLAEQEKQLTLNFDG